MRYIGFYLVISVDITLDNTLMISSDLCSFAVLLCLKSSVSLRVQPMSPSKFAGKPPSWAMLSAVNLVIFSRFDIR